uniref:EF-hand domain-containing protein n=1 Tax=Lotharella oceanica TaxID=641309 RepID=A0A7S2TGW1_9EUKA
MNNGPARYSHKTRIGNWNEDLQMQEDKVRKYLDRKEKGQLMINKIARNMQGSLKPVGLTYAKDGLIRFGDHVMLYSVQTEGVLSTDVTDRDPGNIEAYSVTTSTVTKGPVARNVFVIMPPANDKKTKIGDFFTFGQPFVLKVNPALTTKDLSLASVPLSPMQFSKISKKQLVLMSVDNSADIIFTARYRDVQQRFEMDGQPVPGNAELVLQHRRTGKCLFTDKINYHNDFGAEYEVSCNTSSVANRKGILMHEKSGKMTSDNANKAETPSNYWAFLTATDPSMEKGIQKGKEPDVSVLLASMKKQLIQRAGLRGLTSIARVFRIMNDNFDGFVSESEFKKGVADMGVVLDAKEAKILFKAFDKDNNGKLSYDEFVLAFRGKCNKRRLALVDGAFALMDKTGDGVITIDDLKGVYKPVMDPEVADGKKTQAQHLKEYIGHFENVSTKDGKITLDEWRDYYSGISASIDSDEYFELMMKRAWKGL